MSKQHTKPTVSNRLRRGLAGILTLALLLGLLPSTVVTAQAHWADPYVETLTEWGVMRGDINGNMAPERSITRAEFVTMMNRAYGYTRLAGHPFTDVRTRDWYNEDIDIAYNVGYFKGTSPTAASPNSPLTREQAAVLLARNMMLQETVGETLGFSDTRTLSDWSRGLVGAATENGILGGYSDGSFRPQNNITRGEVAAMLVRAIGTPIQEAGDHTLGNVYGNVTVNTSGVKLRDGVITGNLYLTGGIDLGDVLLENVTVLGEIIVSGSGESNSAQSSIVLRNVKAKNMTVDNISGQFVTIRAEGNTDINTTTVRTSAYVDDSSLPGYGLWKIIQDGGSLLQLAGNIKEVVNQTPDSELQVVQGVADKVTIDEKATGSSVLVDGDARVDELDLDVATNVTGEGDIKDLNVGAAGSTVEQLPDNITIRPGIDADINGSEMNSSQAAQASSEPRLLAGYPKAKNIAPTSATLVFSVNKPGTIYWAISAVADGSVSEDDLIENPSYGGKIIQAGTINATAANTEYTAELTGLTQDGSYYISAILVDGRDKRSPVKVTAFATPDGTVPAFISGPTVTMHTTKTAQVTGTPNKSCQLYWALLPEGAAAPTAAQFKANAITGNLGYGSMDVVKNASQSVNVNRGVLKEKTNYVAYLWLTDHDGAQSSQVYRVPIYIPDETPPIVNDMKQTGGTATSVEASFTMNETGQLHWGIVTDETHEKQLFLAYDKYDEHTATLQYDDEDIALGEKIRLISGTGAIVSGSTPVTGANTLTRILSAATQGLDPEVYNTSSFVLYYVGEDDEGNLSDDIGVLEVNVVDQTAPLFVEQTFSSYGTNDRIHPLADTDITLVFSEPVQSGASRDSSNYFLSMYQAVEKALANVPNGEDPEQNEDVKTARDALAKALYNSIKLYSGTDTEVASDQNPATNVPNVLDYHYAKVVKDGGKMYITFPHTTGFTTTDNGETVPVYGANLTSGTTYHFELQNIYDCAVPPNAMEYNSNACFRVEEFRVASAQVDVNEGTQRPAWMAMAKDENGKTIFTSTPDATNNGGIPAKEIGSNRVSHYVTLGNGAADNNIDTANATANDPSRVDVSFWVHPAASNVDPNICYDMLIWSDTNIEFTLYSRPRTTSPTDSTLTPWSTSNANSWSETGAPLEAATWTKEGSGKIIGASKTDSTSVFSYTSLFGNIKQTTPDLQMNMVDREYVIHVDKVSDGRYGQQDQANVWNETIQFRITFVSGAENRINDLKFTPPTGVSYEEYYNSLVAPDDGLSPISNPEHRLLRVRFTDSQEPTIERLSIVNSDTMPQVNVTMDRPGTVHCVAVPLTNVKFAKDGVATTPAAGQSLSLFLAEGNVVTDFENLEAVYLQDGVTRGDPNNLNPIPYPSAGHTTLVNLSAPSAVKLTGTSFGEGAVKGTGTTASATTAAAVRFEKALSPNTIYLLCMAPQGSTSESLATFASGFYFVTEPAERPILRLTNAGSVNVTAWVDRTAQVQARLLLASSLTDATRVVFAEPFSKIGNIDSTKTLPSGSGYDAPTYTVLNALQDYYPAGNSNNGSVFDEFASAELKQRIQDIVENGSGDVIGNTFYGNWGPVEVPKDGNTWGHDDTEFSQSELDDNAFYVCVAVAYTSAEGPRAFRALTGLQVVNDEPPRITSVSVGNIIYDGTWMSGSVTINFDKALYLPAASGSSGILPMANTPKNDSGTGLTGFRPLGGVMIMPNGGKVQIYEASPTGNYSETSQMVFSIMGMGNSFSIDLPSELCSKWNRSIGAIGGGSITCTVSGPTNQGGTWTKDVSDNLKAPNYR